jgi:hypothetical protein
MRFRASPEIRLSRRFGRASQITGYFGDAGAVFHGYLYAGHTKNWIA